MLVCAVAACSGISTAVVRTTERDFPAFDGTVRVADAAPSGALKVGQVSAAGFRAQRLDLVDAMQSAASNEGANVLVLEHDQAANESSLYGAASRNNGVLVGVTGERRELEASMYRVLTEEEKRESWRYVPWHKRKLQFGLRGEVGVGFRVPLYGDDGPTGGLSISATRWLNSHFGLQTEMSGWKDILWFGAVSLGPVGRWLWLHDFVGIELGASALVGWNSWANLERTYTNHDWYTGEVSIEKDAASVRRGVGLGVRAFLATDLRLTDETALQFSGSLVALNLPESSSGSSVGPKPTKPAGIVGLSLLWTP